jgi:hypothetical protein
MAIMPGEAVEPSQQEVDAFVDARGPHQLPTAFVKVGVSFDRLVAEFGSNHISGVAGHYAAELEHFCRLLDIVPILLDQDPTRRHVDAPSWVGEPAAAHTRNVSDTVPWPSAVDPAAKGA